MFLDSFVYLCHHFFAIGSPCPALMPLYLPGLILVCHPVFSWCPRYACSFLRRDERWSWDKGKVGEDTHEGQSWETSSDGTYCRTNFKTLMNLCFIFLPDVLWISESRILNSQPLPWDQSVPLLLGRHLFSAPFDYTYTDIPTNTQKHTHI